MGQDGPKLGEFGVNVVRTVLAKFTDTRLLGGSKLTIAKYLGAYTTVASQGTLIGLRFRFAPLAVVQLICEPGRESDLAGWLQRQASEVRSEFVGSDAGFLDISMLREQARLLEKLGRSDLTNDPDALGEFLKKQTVNPDTAYGNLVACFSIFLGLGLFEADWVRGAYLKLVPGDQQFNADTHHVEEFVRKWVSELSTALLAQLFPVGRDRLV